MSNPVEQAGPAGYVALVRRNANFRSLWSGQIVSLLGDWFNLIATATLLSELTDSAVALGGLFAVRMLAPFVVSPVAGVFADRYNRKRLLIATDLLRAAVVLGFLLVRSRDQVWLLYALTAVQLGVAGFFFPARNALLPVIVSPGELGAANALSSATWSVMLALGTALGGLVTGAMGAYPAFVIDAGTFVFSAVLLSGIRGSGRIETEAAPARGVLEGFRQYGAGLVYLGRRRGILSLVLLKPLYTVTVSGAIQVAIVTLGERVYPIGEGGGTAMGLGYACMGVGTGLGPILMRLLTRDRPARVRKAILAGYGLVILGVGTAATLHSFPVVLLGVLLNGMGGGAMWVFSTQLLMQEVPDHTRGRVFASEFALFTLCTAIGAWSAGWAIDAPSLGVGGMLRVVSVLAFVPALFWAVCLWRGRTR
mgnify:CR=1 FL=1